MSTLVASINISFFSPEKMLTDFPCEDIFISGKEINPKNIE
jgi:hypothetical protein